MNKFTIIAICLLTAVASSFTTFADRNDVRIVCDDLDANGMLTAYRPHTFQLNHPIPDAENAFWVFNIPCVDEIFDSHVADKDQSLRIPKLSEMLYSDPIVTEQCMVTGTLTYSYELDGKHHETAPLDLEFDLRPKIYKAEIKGVELDDDSNWYHAIYEVEYGGNSYLNVTMKGENDPIIYTEKIEQPDVVSGVTTGAFVEECATLTLEVTNRYGKSSVIYEFTPYGESWQLISDGGGNEKTGPVTLANPHFITQVYDWDLDGMWEGSIFAIDIDCPNATKYELTTITRHPTPFFTLNEFLFPEPSSENQELIVYSYISPLEDTNHFEFNSEWGEVYKFQGWSEEGGWSDYSEPIFSTDYITDPAILARINELKNQASGVEDLLREPDPAADLVHRFGNSLRVSAEVSEMAVFNEKGEKLMHVTDPQGEVSISDLGSGVYFAAAKTPTGLSKTLKFRK